MRDFVEHIQPEVDRWEAMWEARRAEIVADMCDDDVAKVRDKVMQCRTAWLAERHQGVFILVDR